MLFPICWNYPFVLLQCVTITDLVSAFKSAGRAMTVMTAPMSSIRSSSTMLLYQTGYAENASIDFADQVNKVEEFPVVDEQMPVLEKSLL